MDTIYYIYINIPARFVQEIYNYILEKDNKEAALGELRQYFVTVLNMDSGLISPFLVFESRMRVDENTPLFMRIPSNLKLKDDLYKKLSDSMDKQVVQLLCDLEKELLTAIDEKFEVTLRFTENLQLEAIIEIAVSDSVEIDGCEIVEDWPAVIGDE